MVFVNEFFYTGYVVGAFVGMGADHKKLPEALVGCHTLNMESTQRSSSGSGRPSARWRVLRHTCGHQKTSYAVMAKIRLRRRGLHIWFNCVSIPFPMLIWIVFRRFARPI
jgi:hypothetical protein